MRVSEIGNLSTAGAMVAIFVHGLFPARRDEQPILVVVLSEVEVSKCAGPAVDAGGRALHLPDMLPLKYTS